MFSKACALPASCQQQSLRVQKTVALFPSRALPWRAECHPSAPQPAVSLLVPAVPRLGCVHPVPAGQWAQLHGRGRGTSSLCPTGCGSPSSCDDGGLCPQPPGAPPLLAPCRGSPDDSPDTLVMAVAPFGGHQRLGGWGVFACWPLGLAGLCRDTV